MSTFLSWHGLLYEAKGMLERTEEFYRKCLDLRRLEQWYGYAEALTSLARISHMQGDYTTTEHTLHDAEVLAQQYEYNDHLASLRLTQGHMAWDGSTTPWRQGFDAALNYYKQALIYALRYNRFLLDKMLSGRPNDIPWQPIIPYCLRRGKEGEQMLQALLECWQNGFNDVGSPRSDSISPIPEGISLMEGERLARNREPSHGSLQQTVVEQLRQTLIALHN